MSKTREHSHSKPDAEPLAPARLERTAKLFKAAGEPNRLKLLHLLCGKRLCVSELALATGDGVPASSQRLKILLQEGLVSRKRDGRHVRYELRDRHVTELIDNALRHSEETKEDNK